MLERVHRHNTCFYFTVEFYSDTFTIW